MSKKHITDKILQPLLAATALIASFGFFQFLYPYHLMRREQLSIFLYDWDYIIRTYKGFGGAARFVGDFLTQFFYYPVAGPLIVSLILTCIAIVSYKISRKFLGSGLSTVMAALVTCWSFMRECGNWYDLPYTISVLGYLSLALFCLKYCNRWIRVIGCMVPVAVGIFFLGSPYEKESGRLWSRPDIRQEKVIALDLEASRTHWNKVIKLAEKEDLYIDEATYYYNLANAQRGMLSEKLMNHSQHYTFGLFRWVNENESQFTITSAGEAWFYLGDMTQAEQSAMVGLEFSPKHTGARFFVRLAQINLVNEDYGTAMKYLGILSKTLTYRRWALKMMPENHDESTRNWLEYMRSNLATNDFVHLDGDKRPVLRNLLAANPDNMMAREYLLCFDLLAVDLESFMEDYTPNMIPSRLYQEAVMTWLSYHDRLYSHTIRQYGIELEMLNRFRHFSVNPEQYKNTYWYWYMLEQSNQ